MLDAAPKVREAEEIDPREVRTSVGYGGFAWVNLDYDGPSLKDAVGDAMHVLEPHLNRPLKVFLHQQTIVNTDYRLWREKNGEFYLGHLYHSDRIRRMFQPAYCNLHYTALSQWAWVDRLDAYGRCCPGSQAQVLAWSCPGRLDTG